MKLSFEHPKGVRHDLVKHPVVRQKLKANTITEAAARLTAWYYRAPWRPTRPFKFSSDDAAAIRGAKDLLKGRTEQPEVFAQFCQSLEQRRGLTVGQIAAEWLAAGLPFSKTEPRTDKAAAQLRSTLSRCLPWWESKRVAQITANDHADYVVHRRAHNRFTTADPAAQLAGSRSADLELSCLSSLCQWAVKCGRIDANPFETRERYHAAERVQHCHQFAPETDEELHRILSWFWSHQYAQNDLSNRHKAAELDLFTRVAGAWLCFTALTGLRPEEPAFLYRWPRQTTAPPRPAALPAGTIFPDRSGALKMRVIRTKHGQNPFVSLAGPAGAFLDTWEQWLTAHISPRDAVRTHWFPNPFDPVRSICPDGETTLLNKRLSLCCAALGLPERKPKGVGRAFYVAVRRSQGADDATIAGELGQTTNGKLIWSTYGNPDDLRGGALLDWLPAALDPKTQQPVATPPAWSLLQPATPQTNIIRL